MPFEYSHVRITDTSGRYIEGRVTSFREDIDGVLRMHVALPEHDALLPKKEEKET